METLNQNNLQQVAGIANVEPTKEQVVENLTVKAAKKYKDYVAAYVEKYTEPTAKVKKTLQELDMLDEKTLNTALRNFINSDTVKDADDVIRRIKNSNLTADDIKKIAEWAKVEYDAVKEDDLKKKYLTELIAIRKAETNMEKLESELSPEVIENLIIEADKATIGN